MRNRYAVQVYSWVRATTALNLQFTSFNQLILKYLHVPDNDHCKGWSWCSLCRDGSWVLVDGFFEVAFEIEDKNCLMMYSQVLRFSTAIENILVLGEATIK